MANLSQEKRRRMLAFLETIREEHKDDDEVLMALGEIENELNAKKYGLVWERHEEAVDVQMRDNIPVFTECTEREITATEGNYNFLLEGDNLHSLDYWKRPMLAGLTLFTSTHHITEVKRISFMMMTTLFPKTLTVIVNGCHSWKADC